MNLLADSLAIGIIMSLLALGVYISFRIFSFPDITAEGSVTLGAALGALMLVKGYAPLSALLCAFIAGLLAGTVTGLINTKFKINGLLAGILVMTALYSINLNIMGQNNLPILSCATCYTPAESWLSNAFPTSCLSLFGREIQTYDLAGIVVSALIATGLTVISYLLFKTPLGVAMRAAGNNPKMARSIGINHNLMLTMGLALSNGLIAVSGALLAQYQGFADIQMGIGALVYGMACVIIGEWLIKSSSGLGWLLIATLLGAVIFRMLVDLLISWGLPANNLKLITAIFVFFALMLPGIRRRSPHIAICKGADHDNN